MGQYLHCYNFIQHCPDAARLYKVGSRQNVAATTSVTSALYQFHDYVLISRKFTLYFESVWESAVICCILRRKQLYCHAIPYHALLHVKFVRQWMDFEEEDEKEDALNMCG